MKSDYQRDFSQYFSPIDVHNTGTKFIVIIKPFT